MYFWRIHYHVTPVAQPADGLTPNRKRGICVIARNIHAKQMLDFKMPRENEGGTADPATYRGSPDLHNRTSASRAARRERAARARRPDPRRGIPIAGASIPGA